jgi:hypothetical protein
MLAYAGVCGRGSAESGGEGMCVPWVVVASQDAHVYAIAGTLLALLVQNLLALLVQKMWLVRMRTSTPSQVLYLLY